MRTATARRHWSFTSPGLISFLAVAGVLGLLWIFGIIDLSRFAAKAGASTRGRIAVPISAKPIPAYTKVTRDHLWDPKSSDLAVLYLRPEQVSPEMLRDLKEIVGRVLDHDKDAGYVFTAADFFPPGTRPGMVAGIPPGKRAMRVEADKVHGLFGLNPGDRFDLVATLPIDASKAQQNFKFAGVYGQQVDLQARLTNWQKQATVRVLVQNGVVVQPLTTRQVPVYSRTLTQGAVTRAKPIQEMVIAVDPAEVAHLTEAVAVEAQVSCVPRSGRPEDPIHSRTPDLQPWNPFQGLSASGNADASQGPGQPLATIESISGTKRELLAAPVSSGTSR